VSRRWVVVGSGVAGGIVASELLAGGDEVVMLESGPAVPMRDRRVWYDVLMGARDPYAAGRLPDEVLANPEAGDYLRGKLLRLRGGSTLHWDGWAFRFREEDFRLRSLTGRGADWPITYEDLEPFYARAEHTLRVAGDHRDPGHPRREGPFPLPAFPYQQCDERFLDGLAALGAHAQHTCLSRNTQPIDGHARCETIGTCLYCPIGGRFTADLLLDELERSPLFRLETQARAVRIALAGGRLVGVQRARGDTTELLAADGVVVCAGALFSAELLLRSTDALHPGGLGNRSGHLGRYLMNHTGLLGIAAQASNPRRETNEAYTFQTAMSRAFDDPAHQAGGKFQLQQDLRYASDLDGRLGPLARGVLDGRSAGEIARELEGPVFRALLPMTEELPLPESRVSLQDGKLRVEHRRDPRVLDALERARVVCDELFDAMGCQRIQWMDPSPYAHLMGTLRMSAHPDDGVVDPDLQVHDVPGVYVCSSGVYPSTAAVQPTLTLAALAHRLGAHLRSSPSPGAPWNPDADDP
jgi:choline dehydrogenase-like flavoprotein